jgi:hypothetical protein
MCISFLCCTKEKKSNYYNPYGEELERTTGTICGVVTDKETGEPIEGVFVSAQYLGDESSSLGLFKIVYQKPGNVEVEARRRDLISTVMKVNVSAGDTSILNIKMDKAPKACCCLQGNWNVLFILDKIGNFAATHTTDTVKGTLFFDYSITDPFEDNPRKKVDLVKDEYGKYNIDFRPFFGEQVPNTGSTSVFGSKHKGSDLFTEVTGYIASFDVVAINLIPRISHGGISMNGKIKNDTISGSWYLRAYASGTEGRFRMYRQKT